LLGVPACGHPRHASKLMTNDFGQPPSPAPACETGYSRCLQSPQGSEFGCAIALKTCRETGLPTIFPGGRGAEEIADMSETSTSDMFESLSTAWETAINEKREREVVLSGVIAYFFPREEGHRARKRRVDVRARSNRQSVQGQVWPAATSCRSTRVLLLRSSRARNPIGSRSEGVHLRCLCVNSCGGL
jgi:hypothetical protein